jgi:hypothetical protein
MTMPDQRYHALKQSRKFMEELCDPGKTPRVPSAVRDRARSLLKHFPLDSELTFIAEACPEYLDSSSKTAKIRVLK